MTWRQKDREEPTLGLYGKNAFYYTKDGEDDIFMIEEFNKSAPKSARRQRVPKVDSSNGSGVVRKTATVQELSNPSKSGKDTGAPNINHLGFSLTLFIISIRHAGIQRIPADQYYLKSKKQIAIKRHQYESKFNFVIFLQK